MGKVVLYPDFSGIPSHVQAHDRWIVWAEEMVEGRLTKVPYRAGDLSRHASTSDRKTWASYARAKSSYLGNKDRLSGVGYCRDEDEYFIDLDTFFRDRREGDELLGYGFERYGKTFATWEWAGLQPEEIYNRLVSAGAWMEMSPSGYGSHAVVRSSSIVASFDRHVPGVEHCGFALYAANRYLAVTGAQLWPGDLKRDNHALLGQILAWVPQAAKNQAVAGGMRQGGIETQAQSWPIRETAAVNADMSDDAVLARMLKSRKGRILWEGGDPGDLGDNSHSGLDFALCLALAFWTRKDPGQMDRLFRASALYREEKWERVGEETITRAIGIQTEVWEPRVSTGRGVRGDAAQFAAAARRVESKRKATGKEAESNRKESGKEAAPDGAEVDPSGDEPPPPWNGDPPDEAMPPPSGPAWKDLLLTNTKGKPLNCHKNVDVALRYAPEWAGLVVLDEFAQVIRTTAPTPLGEIPSWADEHTTRFAIWMQEQGVMVTPAVAGETIYAIAREHAVHPLREWLESLVWDKKPRINSWLHVYLGAPSTNYTALAGAWWTGQAVARAFHPGCQADYTLVLEGPQGQKKSQALRVLAGDGWFTDQIADFSSKDSSLDLQGRWIVEIAEFDRITHKPSVIKAFLTRMKDRFRPPYGKHPLEFPRQTVFAATVNLEEYFPDDTGNRRFWPVLCGEIKTDKLAEDREQLWAEAVERFERQGERRWPSSPEELGWFRGEQAAREDLDVWHDQIDRWVADPEPALDKHGHPVGSIVSVKKNVTVADVLTHCLMVEPKNQTQAMKGRVAGTLKRLGWKRRMSGTEHARYRAYVLSD